MEERGSTAAEGETVMTRHMTIRRDDIGYNKI